MSEIKYRQSNKNIIQNEILIAIRKKHVSLIVDEFIKHNIISTEYLDNLIKIYNAKNTFILDNKDLFNDENRRAILENILQKECAKGTAKIISSLGN